MNKPAATSGSTHENSAVSSNIGCASPSLVEEGTHPSPDSISDTTSLPHMRLTEHPWRTLNTDPGQGIVEVALLLPLLLLVFMGIFNFGLAAFYQNDETHLANIAARYAAVNGCSDCNGATINDYIPTKAGTDALRNGMTVTITFPAGVTRNHCLGSTVNVTVTYPMQFFTHLFGFGPLTLRESSTMRLEKNWNGNPVTGKGSAADAYDVTPGSASSDSC